MSHTVGPYELRSELGRGGMAVVWRAWDPLLEREVAVKELLIPSGTDAATSAELAARFVREAKATAYLSHPGIVTVHAADIYQGRAALAMELIEGETLAEKLSRGPLPAASCASLLGQVLGALGYAHSRGVVHRGLKPHNIFLTPEGRVKLTDFGIAQVADLTALARAGTVMGTPGYMAPEQVKGLPIDHRADLFSAGVIFYEMLTGRNPFGSSEGLSPTTVMYRICFEDPPELPPEILRDLPLDAAGLLAQALAKNPEERFPDAGVFRAALSGTPISGRLPGPSPVAPTVLLRPAQAPPRHTPSAYAPARVPHTQGPPDRTSSGYVSYGPTSSGYEDPGHTPSEYVPPVYAYSSTSALPRRRLGWMAWVLITGLILLLGAGGFLVYRILERRGEVSDTTSVTTSATTSAPVSVAPSDSASTFASATTTSVTVLTVPTVSINSPRANQVFELGGTVPVEVEAFHDQGVETVRLFANGVLFSELTSPPYRASFDPPSAGVYALRAEVESVTGGWGEDTVTVEVRQSAPVLRVQDVLATIESWRAAWEREDLVSYMSFYAPNFYSNYNKMNRSQWQEYKSGLFKRYSYQRVTIIGVPKVVFTGIRTATVVFEQWFEANSYSDHGVKELHMEIINDRWLIVGEEWRKL